MQLLVRHHAEAPSPTALPPCCSYREGSTRHDLLAWYGRLGFVPAGWTTAPPHGDDHFGRVRRDNLAFVLSPDRQPARGMMRA